MAKKDPHQIKKVVRERYGARARERLAALGLERSRRARQLPVPLLRPI